MVAGVLGLVVTGAFGLIVGARLINEAWNEDPFANTDPLAYDCAMTDATIDDALDLARVEVPDSAKITGWCYNSWMDVTANLGLILDCADVPALAQSGRFEPLHPGTVSTWLDGRVPEWNFASPPTLVYEGYDEEYGVYRDAAVFANGSECRVYLSVYSV